MLDYSRCSADPFLHPSILLSHPDSRHDAITMAPWIVILALGFAMLLDVLQKRALLSGAVSVLLLGAVIFHGTRFFRTYFVNYPVEAAPYFQYGMQQVIDAVRKFDDGKEPLTGCGKTRQTPD
ncbi:MAG: hypothetical protein WA005_18930 [Candidatus Binataceae bacterium]